MTTNNNRLLILFLLLLPFTITADWLTPELLWKLGRVSDPQLSPDGSKVVYSVMRYDLGLNKGNSDIWMYDMNTGSARAIAADSASEVQARWSGDRVYYLF